jgi:Flp pilus assembly pilin Flp
MTFFNKIRRALRDDSGAVTVDWVVLTAAVVILAIGAISALDGGVSALVDQIDTELSDGATTLSSESF